MKRTIYDEGIAITARDVPPEAAGGKTGGRAITFVATENNEHIAFVLPPEGVAELHELTAPPSKVQVERELPPFLKG